MTGLPPREELGMSGCYLGRNEYCICSASGTPHERGSDFACVDPWGAVQEEATCDDGVLSAWSQHYTSGFKCT